MTELKKNFAPTIISCIVVMVVVVTLFVNKVTTETRLTVDELKDLGMYSIDPPRELGDFELVTSSGSRFIPSDFRGNWNFLFFGFTFCPDICPVTIRLAIVDMDEGVFSSIGLVAELKRLKISVIGTKTKITRRTIT